MNVWVIGINSDSSTSKSVKQNGISPITKFGGRPNNGSSFKRPVPNTQIKYN